MIANNTAHAADGSVVMTVGDLARRTGVSAKTLRQYTDWGLVCSLGRSRSNYRMFDAHALWCLDLIDRLRGLGLTLAQIRELTASHQCDADRPCTGEPSTALLAEHLHAARARLNVRIEQMRQTLARIDEFENTHRDEPISANALLTEDRHLSAAGA